MDENTVKMSQQERLIRKSWKYIAPFWPLKNLVAVNPLCGLEDLPIEQALVEGKILFESNELPREMKLINRQTIKWLQAFFDDGHAVIAMPYRSRGLYGSWKTLIRFDLQLIGNKTKMLQWVLDLPESSDDAITQCLMRLNIPEKHQGIFLTLMLTTLPGWASHIKYCIHWKENSMPSKYPVSESDYLAFRLIITTLLWEKASDLLHWYETCRKEVGNDTNFIKQIKKCESAYMLPLLSQLKNQTVSSSVVSDAQLVFCIDVRSEPFRKKIESLGNYETFGFSGFFGIPVRIQNAVTKECYNSCPVLLKPKHTIQDAPDCSKSMQGLDQLAFNRMNTLCALYQALQNNLMTSFVWVGLSGLCLGVWMVLKTFAPFFAEKIRYTVTQLVRPDIPFAPKLDSISLEEQYLYAKSALETIGLVGDFSSLIVFCGHAGAAQNNAYASLLNCGACGGHKGGMNARVLAKILNTADIRNKLYLEGIMIPCATRFFAAEHNTTTDEVIIFADEIFEGSMKNSMDKLKQDLIAAANANGHQRLAAMSLDGIEIRGTKSSKRFALDWSQSYPEWGLALNASFIVAPRNLTKNIDLNGRSFLHSYDYQKDPDALVLTTILTAPMIVAQWINSQYMLSTLDNVAYGSGSKSTSNITGNIGVMQGNASDLMNGLPLQAVHKSATDAYHEPIRLVTIVYAPSNIIDKVIKNNNILQKLFGNGWVHLICIDPILNRYLFLKRDLTWIEESFW